MKFTSVSFDPNKKHNIINILPICKNMSQQRRGRVGRVAPGVYLPIIKRIDFDDLLDYRENMIQISNIRETAFSIGY